jgi:hypothetical protein
MLAGRLPPWIEEEEEEEERDGRKVTFADDSGK